MELRVIPTHVAVIFSLLDIKIIRLLLFIPVWYFIFSSILDDFAFGYAFEWRLRKINYKLIAVYVSTTTEIQSIT